MSASTLENVIGWKIGTYWRDMDALPGAVTAVRFAPYGIINRLMPMLLTDRVEPLTETDRPFVPTRLEVCGTENRIDCAPVLMVSAPPFFDMTTVPEVNVALEAAIATAPVLTEAVMVPIPAPVERPKETPCESLKVSPERAFEVPPVAETLSAHDPQTLPPVFEKLKLFEFVSDSVEKVDEPPCAEKAWPLWVYEAVIAWPAELPKLMPFAFEKDTVPLVYVVLETIMPDMPVWAPAAFAPDIVMEAPFWDRVMLLPPMRTAVPVEIFEYPAPEEVELPPMLMAAAFAPMESVEAFKETLPLPVPTKLTVEKDPVTIELFDMPNERPFEFEKTTVPEVAV